MVDVCGELPPLGSEVTIHSLRSRAAFNGSHGHITRYCKDGLHVEVSLSEQNEKLRVKPENLSPFVATHGAFLRGSPKSSEPSPKSSEQTLEAGVGPVLRRSKADDRMPGCTWRSHDWRPSSASRAPPPPLDFEARGLSKVDVASLASGCVAELRSAVAKVGKAWEAAHGAREQLKGVMQPQKFCHHAASLEEMERIDTAVRGMSGWAQDLDISGISDVSESPQRYDHFCVENATASPSMGRRSSSCTRLREQVARASQHPSLSTPVKKSMKTGISKGSPSGASTADEDPEWTEKPVVSDLMEDGCLDGPPKERQCVAAYVRAIGEAAVAAAVEAQLSASPLQGVTGSTGETGDTSEGPACPFNSAAENAPEETIDPRNCLVDLVARGDNLSLDFHDHTMVAAGPEFNGLMYFTGLKMLTVDLDHCRQLESLDEIGRSFAALSKLQELVLQCRHCSQLADIDGLCHGMRALSDLKVLRLDLGHCNGIASLGGLGRSLAELTLLGSLTLNLCNCTSLQDVTEVGNSFRHLSELRTLALDLSQCSQLTQLLELGMGMAYLTELRSCKLDFSGCSRLQDINALGKALASLSSLSSFALDLHNCTQVANIDELRTGLKQLSQLQTVALDMTECESLPPICRFFPQRSKIADLRELKDFFEDQGEDRSNRGMSKQQGSEQVQQASEKTKKKAKAIVLEESLDEHYEPTIDEIEEYAAWLGMDLLKDRELFWIARAALKEPVPKPWKPCRMDDAEDIFYFNFETGDSIWDHPCDLRFKEVYEEEKQKQANKEEGETRSSGTAMELQEAPPAPSSAREAAPVQAAPAQAAPIDSSAEVSQTRSPEQAACGSDTPGSESAPVAPQPKGSNASSRARRFNVSFPSR